MTVSSDTASSSHTSTSAVPSAWHRSKNTAKKLLRLPRAKRRSRVSCPLAQTAPRAVLLAIFSKLDKVTLANCALVCRAWMPYAYQALFSYYAIPKLVTRYSNNSRPTFPEFVKAVEHSHRLSRSIRVLALFDIQIDYPLFQAILAHLVNLCAIQIDGVQFHQLDPSHEPTSRMLLRTLKAAVIHDRGKPMPDGQILSDILLCFSDIDALKLFDSANMRNPVKSNLLQQVEHHRNLRVRELTIDSPFYLDAIEPFTLDTLTIRVSNPFDIQPLHDIISRYGQNIHTLTLHVQAAVANMPGLPSPDALQPSCLSLSGCGASLKVMKLEFQASIVGLPLNQEICSTWQRYVSGIIHPGIDELAIHIALTVPPELLGDDALRALFETLDWQALDTVALHCTELRKVVLDINMHSPGEDNDGPRVASAVPPSLGRYFSDRTLSMIHISLSIGPHR